MKYPSGHVPEAKKTGSKVGSGPKAVKEEHSKGEWGGFTKKHSGKGKS